MAIIGTLPAPDQWSASTDAQMRRDTVIVYDVYCNSLNDGPVYVRDKCGISIGSGYSYNGDADSYSRCVKVEANFISNITYDPINEVTLPSGGRHFQVIATYGQPDPYTQGPVLDRKPRVSVNGEFVEKIATKDVDGTPIVNTAGEPFENPLMRETPISNIRITRNESSPDIWGLMGKAGQLNSTTWFGAPPRTVKFGMPEFEEEVDQELGTNYFACTYTFQYNPDGWDEKLLNCGYKQIGKDSSNNPQLQTIVTEGGAAQGPFMLDINGKYLPPPYDGEYYADPSTDTDVGPGDDDGEANEVGTITGTPSPIVYLVFQMRLDFDFNTEFNFPSTLFTGGEGF